jgi:hypothetical protein
MTVEAFSGYMTVYFHRSPEAALSSAPLDAFNATYRVLQCPDNCPAPRVCEKSLDEKEKSVGTGWCVCPEGWYGADCQFLKCLNDCNSDKGYGQCNSVSEMSQITLFSILKSTLVD